MKKKKSRSSETLGSEEGEDEASGNNEDEADGEESVSSYSSYSEEDEEKIEKGSKSDTKSVVTFSSQHEKTKMMKMFEQTPLCFTSKG